MFGRNRTLSASAVADRLYEAADLIAKAAKLLDDACCGASTSLVAQIEAVPNQDKIERSLGLALNACADAIMDAYEAEVAAEEAGFAAADAVADARQAVA